MSIAVVPSIEELRVAAVDDLHAARKRRLLCLDDQVVMVGHQAERMAGPVVPSDDGAEQRQERLPVDVVEEDLAMIRATVGE